MAGTEMTTFWTTSLSVIKPHFIMAQLTDVMATSGKQNAREQLLGGSSIEDRSKLYSVSARKRLRENA